MKKVTYTEALGESVRWARSIDTYSAEFGALGAQAASTSSLAWSAIARECRERSVPDAKPVSGFGSVRLASDPPSNHETILAWIDNDWIVAEFIWEDSTPSWIAVHNYLELEGVTHWRALPEGPNGA